MLVLDIQEYPFILQKQLFMKEFILWGEKSLDCEYATDIEKIIRSHSIERKLF